MEENLPTNIPSPFPEHEAGEGCWSELTRRNSDSSAITVDISKDFAHHNANAILGQSTEWTDGKHSLYINSLEASFVKQLHRSMGVYDCRSQENVRGNCSSGKLQANAHNSSAQFMVLRDGCWQKINSDKDEPLLNSTADSHATLESICYLTSAGKRHPVTCPDPREHSMHCSDRIYSRGNMAFSHESARSSEQHPECNVCHLNLVGSSTEVSDQNFMDEDYREKPSCASMAKRLKMTETDASRNDQVVPFGKSPTVGVTIVNRPSSEREEQINHELQSEQPDSFACPKSDLCYFRSGS